MNFLSSLPHYDRAQVTRWLGTHTISKAISYIRSVREIDWDNGYLAASVQGTMREPYEVTIYFHQTGKRLEIEGECTCPVGYECKHMAAVLLACIERRNVSDSPVAPALPPVRAEVTRWLQGFRDRADAAAKKSRTGNAKQALVYTLVYSKSNQRHEIRIYKASVARDGAIRSMGSPWNAVRKAR